MGKRRGVKRAHINSLLFTNTPSPAWSTAQKLRSGLDHLQQLKKQKKQKPHTATHSHIDQYNFTAIQRTIKTKRPLMKRCHNWLKSTAKAWRTSIEKKARKGLVQLHVYELSGGLKGRLLHIKLNSNFERFIFIRQYLALTLFANIYTYIFTNSQGIRIAH